MSIWLLVGVAVVAWLVVGAAFCLWLGRLLRARRRVDTLELPPWIEFPAGTRLEVASPIRVSAGDGGNGVAISGLELKAGGNDAA